MRSKEKRQHEFSFFDIVNDNKMASDGPPNGRTLHPAVHPKLFHPEDSETGSAQILMPIRSEAAHVLICSEDMYEEAQEVSQKIQSEMERCQIMISTDKSTFDQEHLPLSSFKTLYLFVDSVLAASMLRKGRLHNSVYDFFDAVDDANKVVYVLNKFDRKDRMYNEILYQLPGGCTKEMKDIRVTTERRQETDMLKLDTESDSYSDSGDEEGRSTPEGNHQLGLDADNVNSVAGELQIQQVNATDELKALSLNEDRNTGSSSLNCMIGSHCTMNIIPSSNQLVIARQDGSENIVNVKIAPSSETSRLIIVITTDPNNPELEKLLVQEIDAKKEVLNIKLKSSDAQIVSVKKGSVIIEIEVKQGQPMGSEWIERVLKTVLQSDLKTVIPDGTQLNLDIESNLVVPFDSLGKYVDTDRSHAALETVQRDKERSPVPVDELKKTLECVVNIGIKSESGDADYTDVAIDLLDVLAKLHEEDSWTYAKEHPKLFSVGGIFYRQVERDIGLSHEKHFQLPSFTGKVFLFNSTSKTIELCVDPHGHYPIGPDIHTRIHKKIPTKKSGKLPFGGKESKRMKHNIRSKSPQKHEKMTKIPETIVSKYDRDESNLSDSPFQPEISDKLGEIQKAKEADSGLSDLQRFSDMDDDVKLTKQINQGKAKSIQTDSGLSDVY